MDASSLLALLTALGDTPLKAFAPWVPVIMATSAVLAAVLPQPAPDSKWAPARKLLDMLASNVGHATNATVKGPTTNA